MTHVAYPGCYCADCVEGSPHERHNDLRGYIVGNGDRTKWRAWINGMPAWVDNPADATRYGFRSDANAVHAEDEDAWCVVKYEDVATPSARITGDKDRGNPVEGAPTNRWLAIEVKRLRSVLRYITELAYVDHQSGNQNYEYLQGIADSALRINAQTEKLVEGAPHYATLQAGVALYEALRRNRIGWENALDLDLLPERHRPAAQALIDEAETVLKQWREVAQ